ncbi:MAG: UMP kinase, partial [Clostridia bacterium]|nr:UMP kinase [Clostridia bacterium]
MAAYKRVIIKISGEALGGEAGTGLDEQFIDHIAEDIIAVKNAGVQIGIVVGGGNFWRGGKAKFMSDRATADHMGMLATVMNALAIAGAVRSLGVEAEVFTATPMTPIAHYYRKEDAIAVLERGGVALIAGGTGNPFFTT